MLNKSDDEEKISGGTGPSWLPHQWLARMEEPREHGEGIARLDEETP
jgi:hypothetical protein